MPPIHAIPAELKTLISLYNNGEYLELENRLGPLIAKHPDSIQLWKLYCATLQIQNKEALPALRHAAKHFPQDAELHNSIGINWQAQGRLDEAMAGYRRALKIDPVFVEAHYNLGNALCDLGKFEEAVNCYRRALNIYPNHAMIHSNLGAALKELGRFDEAYASCRRALQLEPGFAELHCNMGTALKDLGQLEAALSSYRHALEIKPDYAEAYYCLGNILHDTGHPDDAVANYLKALELKPDYSDARSNLLFLYSYHALVDPLEYLIQARNWEHACVSEQDRREARNRDFQRRPLTGRRLRVGYVSGDYWQHAVSYFIEQLFAQHDRSRIELFAYYTQRKCDAVTEHFQHLAEHWVPLAGLPDGTIRERIESDGIDVLVDLSGHTMHNRLGVFARRAAPVQTYYLGYFASTGLSEMDYWIGDESLTPVKTDNHFSEQVWRLPRISWSYDGKDAPLPVWQPDPKGTVWLGSFNNLSKLTPATLKLWANVLHALPESKLLLKNIELGDNSNKQRILDAMAGHGIIPERIELKDPNATPGWHEHMSYYDRLDIALDPVGAMGGVTTTCDALWMAVPIIALQGDRVASRATAAILESLGHAEWIAQSEVEYIDKVVALAGDIKQRRIIRENQRSLMAASPLCDARGLAKSLEDAYFMMFEQWLNSRKISPAEQVTQLVVNKT